MKCFRLVVTFAALTPSLAYSQNQPFSDCRTLENAGNFVGSDEVLLNGLVCKIGKPRTNAAPIEAAPKAAERSGALLGIIEPSRLDASQTAGSSTRSAEPAPATISAAVPRDSVEAGAPQSPSAETIPYKSLGEIARAYRKDSKAQVTTVREKGDPDESKQSEEVLRAKTPEVDAISIESALDRRTPRSVAAAAKGMVEKSETAATRPSAALPALSKAPETARSDVRQAQPNQRQPEASLVTAEPPAFEVAPRSTAAPTTSPGDPAVQGPSPTEMLASAHRDPIEHAADSPGSGRTADAPTLRPELSLAVGAFALPRGASADPPAQPPAYTADEDAAFKEGQLANCVKNVSLGSMEKEKLFLAIPDWALHWYEKNQKRFSRICFSDSLMPGAQNYLIVFNTAAAPVAGTELTNASAAGEATPAGGRFTASYGSTWHYAYERTVTTTIMSVSAEKAPHNQPAKLLDATAYSDQGIPVSRHSARPRTKRDNKEPTKAGKSDGDLSEFQDMVGLLSRTVEDIAKL